MSWTRAFEILLPQGPCDFFKLEKQFLTSAGRNREITNIIFFVSMAILSIRVYISFQNY